MGKHFLLNCYEISIIAFKDSFWERISETTTKLITIILFVKQISHFIRLSKAIFYFRNERKKQYKIIKYFHLWQIPRKQNGYFQVHKQNLNHLFRSYIIFVNVCIYLKYLIFMHLLCIFIYHYAFLICIIYWFSY